MLRPCSQRGFWWQKAKSAGPSTGQVEAWQGNLCPPTHLAHLSQSSSGAARVDCLTNLITLVHLAAWRKIIPFKFDPIFAFVVITMENRPFEPLSSRAEWEVIYSKPLLRTPNVPAGHRCSALLRGLIPLSSNPHRASPNSPSLELLTTSWPRIRSK